MTDYDLLLGVDPERAKAILRESGIICQNVFVTAPPRDPNKKGTLRVVAVRDCGQTLIAAAFNDSLAQNGSGDS